MDKYAKARDFQSLVSQGFNEVEMSYAYVHIFVHLYPIQQKPQLGSRTT